MIYQPFFPSYGSNQVIAPAAASAAITINKENKQVRIVNTGANIMYVQTYSSLESPAPVATTADFPIAAGMAATITKSMDHDRLCYISATGTTANVMTGEGF